MRAIRTVPFASLIGLAVVAAVAPRAGRTDVTIQQQTQFDFAIIKAHGTRTESTTTDKRRSDSDMHCEGFMSMFCGNTQTGEIIRLDRDVEWSLEPKKMEYRGNALADRSAAGCRQTGGAGNDGENQAVPCRRPTLGTGPGHLEV